MQTPVEHPNKPQGLRIEPVTFLLWGDAARRPPLNFYLFLKNLTPHFGILRRAQKNKAMFSCRPPTADRACFVCLSPPDLREKERRKRNPQKMSRAQLLLPVISLLQSKSITSGARGAAQRFRVGLVFTVPAGSIRLVPPTSPRRAVHL